MKNATHTVSIVEALYMPDLLKAELKAKDAEKSFITVVLNEATIAHIHEAMTNEFDDKCIDFKECLRIAETCKDLHFDELAGDILKHLETMHSDAYRNYKQRLITDTSSADGSDNR